MKIAISSTGEDMDARIDPGFGRCHYFLVVDSDMMHFEAFENESAALGGGAGVQAARFVASKGAETLITGQCGPKAVRILQAAGIQLYVGHTGTVREAIERYMTGTLAPTGEANAPAHAGMGGGRGRRRQSSC